MVNSVADGDDLMETLDLDTHDLRQGDDEKYITEKKKNKKR